MVTGKVRRLVVGALFLLLALPAPFVLSGCGEGGDQEEEEGDVAYVPYPYQGDGGEGERREGEGERERGDRGFVQDSARGSSTPAADQQAAARQASTELRTGTGPAAHATDRVVVSYLARSQDGRILTSSQESHQALQFTIGHCRALGGWDRALIGMSPGGVRRVTIPARDVRSLKVLGAWPQDSPLVVDVTLLALQPDGRQTDRKADARTK